MTLLKKRPMAIAVAVLVMLSSTLFSARRGLTRQCSAVEQQFYTGAAGDYTGIYAQLEYAADSANRIVAELAVQGTEAADLRETRAALLDTLESGDLHGIHTAAEAMFAAADTLYAGLDTQALPEDSRAYIEQAMDDLHGAHRVIRDSGYNAAVEALETEVLSRFPANVLAELTRVQAPMRYE